MILDPLRRALVRWLTPAATSVSPISEPKQPFGQMTLMGATYNFDAPRILQGESPVEAVQRYLNEGGRIENIPGWGDRHVVNETHRHGIKPPSDPAAQGWTWSAWKREIDAGAHPGWSACRFANRIGPDQAAFVFGIVRGPFGIWRQPFDVCASGAERTERILTCLTHLNSGLGIGIFYDRAIAVEAAEIATRVCPGWETLDENDLAWNEVFARTRAAWTGIGVRFLDDEHCHDQSGGGTYGIYSRTEESMMDGRPEKTS